MFLLPTDNTRLVGFEALLAHAMMAAPAISTEAFTKAYVPRNSYAAPIFDETGDDDEAFLAQE